MMNEQLKKTIDNERGLASIEATVLAVLFVSMLYYTFGFFGIVHTAVVHNIHSRTYTFETFRHRANLMYFRSNSGADPQHYYNIGVRLHGINTDGESNPQQQVATERPITMGVETQEQGRENQTHLSEIFSNRLPASGRNQSIAVNPVWIMTMYGLCLNSQCGG